MIAVIAKLTVKDGKMKEVIGMIKELMVDVAKEEGTLYYTMNRDPNEPNKVIIMERYTDQAALDYHSSTPHFKGFFEKAAGLIGGKPEVSVMEEIHSI